MRVCGVEWSEEMGRASGGKGGMHALHRSGWLEPTVRAQERIRTVSPDRWRLASSISRSETHEPARANLRANQATEGSQR